ncbi:arginase family hydrolase, arginase/agmainase/formiminoglutamate hydrolase [Rhizobium leguminosarum bv. trifolii WSM2297]|uniref:Arginase family hydrolase, arginase/agmainase/formiminoglutamate hydrolase n=1 Tax=Rhizobium leguminosarum bv. trifolii WSM2297 TaxID=754762 RepID=J0W0V2_RHILT|nr:agmatinase [Rhizobium leguminosarum]EJC79311.1 arginase family hydrolase, arginase/agmainase/formiminoglutamate hydrolase [Rhizobium leguminosarum bv. trifolii WSM2297]
MTASPTFLGLPNRLADDRLPRAVIFAAAHGSTYPGKDSSGYALASGAIRAASQDDAGLVEHWDFDLGGPLFDGKPISCIDVGDIETTMHDNAGNRARIEAKTREILSSPAIPILLGGDCSVTIPFLAGFAAQGPVRVLQIDAHIDWRDEVHGERYGYSSPMRRASEMLHVAGIVQVGLRGVGSARISDMEAAQRYGSCLVTAREVHARGVEAALQHIPEGAQVVVTLDCDSIDPGIMPGVAARTPGGLTYTQLIDLIAGLGRRARIAGFDLVELYPPAEIGGLSALTAARLLVNVIGAIVRQV